MPSHLFLIILKKYIYKKRHRVPIKIELKIFSIKIKFKNVDGFTGGCFLFVVNFCLELKFLGMQNDNY